MLYTLIVTVAALTGPPQVITIPGYKDYSACLMAGQQYRNYYYGQRVDVKCVTQ